MRAFRIIALALALSACATSPGDKAPGCHGALRPANPNGSILSPDLPPPAPAAPRAGGCGTPS